MVFVTREEPEFLPDIRDFTTDIRDCILRDFETQVLRMVRVIYRE